MSLSEIALRHLARRDILSLVSLVLTSFRRFPLFDFLYSPLRSDINNAQDTIFFWNLRLRKALWDPSAMLIVAEVPPERLPNTLGDDPTAIDRDSWEMWDWLQSQSKPRFNSGFGRNSIVGFALWRRVGADAPQNNRCISLPGRLEQIIIDIQLWFYGRFYKRKDVHAERYAAYLTSEDVLQEKYHTGSFLYLDNLCVDFRLHGSGIGRKLLEFGQEYARNENLPIRTETTENNVEFYKKVDFYSIGIWEVQAPAGTSPMALTVLEWKDENN